MSVQEIADSCGDGCHVRTVYRDLDALSDVGIPVWREGGRVALLAARGAWFITPHAVRRYIDRIAPHLTYEQALAELIHESERAHMVKVVEDVEHWRGAKPRRLRFRVSRRGAGLPQLITVLRGHDRC